MADSPGGPAPDEIHERVAVRLRELDQRYTHGRRRLVSLLVEAGRPVTQPELGEMEPELPQSSMYRNLEALERTGLVRRIAVGSDHARYELAEQILGHHHHLICIDCGTIEDVTLSPAFERQIESELAAAATEKGYDPVHHNLDLHGRCAACA